MSNTSDRRDYIPYAAISHVLRFAATHPSCYELAREILTVGLAQPQEFKAGFINGLVRLFKDEETDPDAWLKFRAKLQALVLKGQALVQAADMLLQDWQIDESAVAQMSLFRQRHEAGEVVIDDGGVRVDPHTGEVLPHGQGGDDDD